MKIQFMRKSILAFCICGALCSPLLGQERGTESQLASLRISLRNLCDHPVKAAKIVIRQGKFRRRLKSGDDGEAHTQLPAGTYNVTVEKYAFKRYIVDVVVKSGDSDTQVELKMEAGYASNDPGPYESCPE